MILLNVCSCADADLRRGVIDRYIAGHRSAAGIHRNTGSGPYKHGDRSRCVGNIIGDAGTVRKCLGDRSYIVDLNQ